MKSINHPNIVKYIGSFWKDTQNSTFAIIIDYYQNGNLSKFTKDTIGILNIDSRLI